MNSKKKFYYNYRRPDNNSLNIFKDKKIILNNPTSFNDPFDGQLDLKSALEFALKNAKYTHYEKYLKQIYHKINVEDIVNSTKNMGVFCMSMPINSDAPDTILMWSHYAMKHTGFCIGFDFRKSEIRRNIHKVNYTEDNPYIDVLQQESIMEKSEDEFIRRLKNAGILNKELNWQYECEWRIIKNDCGEISIDPLIIKEVIFGFKMKPCRKIRIKSLLSSQEWKHVKLNQAVQDGTNLRLKIRPANESDYHQNT